MAGLPKVKIEYGTGALGQSIASADGLLCLVVCGATPVVDKFVLAELYSLRKFDDLDTLGITEENNALLQKVVTEFYAEAPEGTQLHVIGYPDTLKMSDVLDKNKPYARKVIEETNGKVRGFILTKKEGEAPTLANGLNNDLSLAMLNAQALGDWSTESKYAPIFTLLDGLSFSGNAQELEDLKMQKYNRVGVVLGTAEQDSPNQAVGFIAGRIARSNVSNNIGRVADGALKTLKMFAKETPIEQADVESIYEKGYITFRTFTGISGYFIADDFLATTATDDYNQLTRRRTVDKAYRIAYAILVEKLLEKVPVKADGTMLATEIAAWQQMVESAIARNMTSNGELSDDNGDKGVKCIIDAQQNVLATGAVKADLRIRPFGYARYINVTLGFTVNQ